VGRDIKTQFIDSLRGNTELKI